MKVFPKCDSWVDNGNNLKISYLCMLMHIQEFKNYIFSTKNKTKEDICRREVKKTIRLSGFVLVV